MPTKSARSTAASKSATPAAASKGSTATSKPRRPASRRRAGSSRSTTGERWPDRGAVAERAYFIHLEEGSSDAIGNWLRAERELSAV